MAVMMLDGRADGVVRTGGSDGCCLDPASLLAGAAPSDPSALTDAFRAVAAGDRVCVRLVDGSFVDGVVSGSSPGLTAGVSPMLWLARPTGVAQAVYADQADCLVRVTPN